MGRLADGIDSSRELLCSDLLLLEEVTMSLLFFSLSAAMGDNDREGTSARGGWYLGDGVSPLPAGGLSVLLLRSS